MSNSRATGYEEMCRAFGIVPNPDSVALEKGIEEAGKKRLKELGRNKPNRTSAASYEKLSRAFGLAPHHMVLEVAMELDEEEKTKPRTKSKSK